MKEHTLRPVLARCLTLAAGLALAAWALLAPVRPAHAMGSPPRCAAGYAEQVLYYNTFNHQAVLGETDIDCAGHNTHTGLTTPYFTYTCTAC